MLQKRDRVIATLLVWIAVLVALSMAIGRLSFIALDMWGMWYHPGSVITGATSEEAMRILNDFQTFNSELYNQTQQFARAEMLAYLPYVVLIGAVLLVGGVLSTMFIWRSVAVPAEVREAIAAGKDQTIRRPEVFELDDDGELIQTEIDSQPSRNHR